ncbi:MAG TPA: type I-E CRISPR-associated protein Cas7/Cse4/CasC [Actinobacteria bacterium]|nr:type I-E CRISPR-associated protein Cas7/Cse4/CasC [Actinomycetota bacterium]
MIIELHVIQNLPPSNVNRGEDGSPKDATFGGVRRSRVSSQAQKRAVRSAMAELLGDPSLFGLRSRRHVRRLAEVLGERNPEWTGEQTALLAKTIVAPLAGSGDDGVTEVQLFLSLAELERLADLAAEAADEILSAKKPDPDKIVVDDRKLSDVVTKALADPAAVDIALFGRMLANRPERNIDGAVAVAHAIATHRTEFEFDFFTSVDDLAEPGEPGASMMDITGFVAPCLYRYSVVDVDAYRTIAAGVDPDLLDAALAAYLETFPTTLPSGKQRSYAAYVPPAFVLGVVRPAGAISLANAFATPVNPRGNLVGNSIGALVGHWATIDSTFHTDRNRPIAVHVLSAAGSDIPPPLDAAVFNGPIDRFAQTLVDAATP